MCSTLNGPIPALAIFKRIMVCVANLLLNTIMLPSFHIFQAMSILSESMAFRRLRPSWTMAYHHDLMWIHTQGLDGNQADEATRTKLRTRMANLHRKSNWDAVDACCEGGNCQNSSSLASWGGPSPTRSLGYAVWQSTIILVINFFKKAYERFNIDQS